MRIIPLSEGSFTIDKTKLFVPFDEVSDVLQERPTGSLLVEVQPFVVDTGTELILLDTGLGFAGADGRMQIHQNLLSQGIQPADIRKVLLSHLHKDHAGGVAETADRGKLAFPGADYYIQEKELAFAFEKGFPSFIPEELDALKTAPNVILLKDPKGMIGEEIEYEVTGAHSPFHQVFRIRIDNEIVFFGGDDAPQLQQMKHRFTAKYDFDGRKAMELRQRWWKEGEAGKWTFLFYHDVSNAVWKF